jgi:F-type H+-transporting ATPase subunit gamma
VIGHLAHANTEYKHPFLVERERSSASATSWCRPTAACAAASTQHVPQAARRHPQWQDKGVEVDLVTIGQKATLLPPPQGRWSAACRLGERQLEQLIGVIKVMLDAYTEGKVDRVFLAYNRFVNTMTQKATVDSCCRCRRRRPGGSHDWDYIYEPDAEPCSNTC